MSENDDTLRSLVKMGYKQVEALIAIERLGAFCMIHSYVWLELLACYFCKNDRNLFYYCCLLYDTDSLSSIGFEHLDLCPLGN